MHILSWIWSRSVNCRKDILMKKDDPYLPWIVSSSGILFQTEIILLVQRFRSTRTVAQHNSIYTRSFIYCVSLNQIDHKCLPCVLGDVEQFSRHRICAYDCLCYTLTCLILSCWSKKGSCQLMAREWALSTGWSLSRSKFAQENSGYVNWPPHHDHSYWPWMLNTT